MSRPQTPASLPPHPPYRTPALPLAGARSRIDTHATTTIAAATVAVAAAATAVTVVTTVTTVTTTTTTTTTTTQA